MQQLITDTLAAVEAGRHAEALRMARELVRSLPGNEGALSMLAVCEQNAGNLVAARDLLQSLTRDHPGTWQHWNNFGNALRQLGELPAAGDAYARALELNQSSVRLQANLGLLHLNTGDFVRARDRLCTAATMDGVEPGMLIWAAVACHACTDDAAARSLVADWRRWPRQSDEAMLELGWLLFQLGQTADAEAILSSEFHDPASRMRAHARRVLVLERLNRMDDAVALERDLPVADTIAESMTRMEVLQARALIAMRKGDYAVARAHYTAALALDLPQRQRGSLYFGLASACDQLGDVAAAMDALAQAHAAEPADRLAAEQARLAGTGLLALIESDLELADTADWIAHDEPSSSNAAPPAVPVFVVGFPRSGTTLMEQMLAAHPDFVSLDEKPMLQRAIERMRGLELRYPADLGKLTGADCDALRAAYWEEAARHTSVPTGRRLVDKHPLNFLALPMLRRLFPEAPLIFCMRHPCDAILSCYMQQFRDPRLAALCVSTERLALEFVRLNQRWLHDSALLPNHVLVCRYEELVSDLDGQLQRIGEFLGVVDASAMRGFSEHARTRGFIGTPSYSQVVQPISSDAVGRWQRYRAYLEPILPILAPIMQHYQYEA